MRINYTSLITGKALKIGLVHLSGNFQLEVLSRISQALAHSQDVTSLLQECLEILDTELGFQRGIFTLKHPDDPVLSIVASKGLSDEEVARGNYAVGEGVTGKVAETLEAELIPNISADGISHLRRGGFRLNGRIIAGIGSCLRANIH